MNNDNLNPKNINYCDLLDQWIKDKGAMEKKEQIIKGLIARGMKKAKDNENTFFLNNSYEGLLFKIVFAKVAILVFTDVKRFGDNNEPLDDGWIQLYSDDTALDLNLCDADNTVSSVLSDIDEVFAYIISQLNYCVKKIQT